ncbi:MAG: helix-turn-helix domain-containing protein [Clostridiales bacterium]|jgi:transcriptional regulator with XRE-family HTH domain|nr:helix-turn-helix domain-containing protein [Clostridiales bacterium]
MKENNYFGENLKQLRTESKMSQEKFASLLNTSRQRVSEWECGKVEPSLFNILKIMEILNCSFDELTDRMK